MTAVCHVHGQYIVYTDAYFKSQTLKEDLLNVDDVHYICHI